MHGESSDMDGPSGRETLVIVLVIPAFVAGDVFFQALLAFPLTCRQWAWAFLISGFLLVVILAGILVLLVPWPAWGDGWG